MENVRIVAGMVLVGLGLFVYVVSVFGLFRFQYVLNWVFYSFCWG